mmetsp:Transcript_59857/g.195366  ORF Transcript_59857/g.195366 Transcript_59857/m.195366 type:complete len:206 (+) Transcript_59857:323-940(+)
MADTYPLAAGVRAHHAGLQGGIPQDLLRRCHPGGSARTGLPGGLRHGLRAHRVALLNLQVRQLLGASPLQRLGLRRQRADQRGRHHGLARGTLRPGHNWLRHRRSHGRICSRQGLPRRWPRRYWTRHVRGRHRRDGRRDVETTFQVLQVRRHLRLVAGRPRDLTRVQLLQPRRRRVDAGRPWPRPAGAAVWRLLGGRRQQRGPRQ